MRNPSSARLKPVVPGHPFLVCVSTQRNSRSRMTWPSSLIAPGCLKISVESNSHRAKLRRRYLLSSTCDFTMYFPANATLRGARWAMFPGTRAIPDWPNLKTRPTSGIRNLPQPRLEMTSRPSALRSPKAKAHTSSGSHASWALIRRRASNDWKRDSRIQTRRPGLGRRSRLET